MSDKQDAQPMELRGEKQEHGVQVVLGRKGSAYARGGVHGTQAENLLGKRALEVSGEEADGHSLDGSSVTGKRQRDDVLAEVTDDPAGPATGAVVAEGFEGIYGPHGVRGTTHTPAPDNEGGPANAAPASAQARAPAAAPAKAAAPPPPAQPAPAPSPPAAPPTPAPPTTGTG